MKKNNIRIIIFSKQNIQPPQEEQKQVQQQPTLKENLKKFEDDIQKITNFKGEYWIRFLKYLRKGECGATRKVHFDRAIQRICIQPLVAQYQELWRKYTPINKTIRKSIINIQKDLKILKQQFILKKYLTRQDETEKLQKHLAEINEILINII